LKSNFDISLIMPVWKVNFLKLSEGLQNYYKCTIGESGGWVRYGWD
jgi:hypothetical protein